MMARLAVGLVSILAGLLLLLSLRYADRLDKAQGACRLRGWEAYDSAADACYKRVYEPREAK